MRFTSDSELCAELLTGYISAANEIVDTKGRLDPCPSPSSRQLAAALIENALKRKSGARKQLFIHKKGQH